ncbi:MAG: hypothetical protein BGO55_03320 [Sphingobacteriales bacterium 50-39]|nr:MAG: hypothetical protein BGO55_03320 [Sphingobacteriales bacterium 50-39]
MNMKHQPILFVAGIVSFLLGLIIRYYTGRRRFNRRTPFGLQQYRSYNEALATRSGEGCARVIGTLLALAGLVLIFVGLA